MSQTALDAIRARFKTSWTTTPIAWENMPFDPESPGGSFQAGGPWVFFEVLGGGEELASIGDAGGASLYRQAGLIYAHIFVPTKSGVGDVDQYRTAIAALFRGKLFNGVQCMAPSYSEGEADDKGKWYRKTVSIPFQYDAVYTTSG